MLESLLESDKYLQSVDPVLDFVPALLDHILVEVLGHREVILVCSN